MILNRVSIEKRPAVVDQRSRIGDWEMDTIIGAHQESAFSGRTQIPIMPDCPVGEQICSRGRANFHQLTEFDQRKSAHRYLIMEKNLPSINPAAKNLDAQFFFAHPYASGKEDSMKTPMDSSDNTWKKLNSTISRISKSSR